MGDVKIVDFGSPAARERARLADKLEKIAGHIRRNEVEYEPHGFILMLLSNQNPAQWEALNVGVPTTMDVERAAAAIRSRIPRQTIRFKPHGGDGGKK